MKSKILISLIAFSLLLTGVLAVTIPYTFPSTNITTQNNSQNIIFNYTCEEWFCPITYAWDIGGSNAVNLTLDSSLVGWWQFNNLSSLEENDTHVKDLSKYGNNGSIMSLGNWTNAGYHGGALNLSDGTASAWLGGVNVSSGITQNNTELSTCLWTYRLGKGGGSTGRLFSNGKYTARFVDSNNQLGLNVNGIELKTASWLFNASVWIHYCLITNYTGYSKIYKDSVLVAEGNTNVTLVGTTNLYIGNQADLTRGYNGLIDDMMIFNRSLSALEVEQIYKSELTKYDYQNRTLIISENLTNPSLLNSTNPSDTFNYNFYISNSTTSTSLGQRTITEIVPLATITSNFTSAIKTVSNDFYGVNYQSQQGWYSADKDRLINCSVGAATDYEFNRLQFLNSGMKSIRWTAYLENHVYSNMSAHGISEDAEIIKFAYDNGISVLLIASRMPEWLANKSSPWCENVTEWYYCPAENDNYTAFGNAMVSYINAVTNNGAYISAIKSVEVFNEPDIGFLSELTDDNITTALEYVKMFNATYLAINATYPQLTVYGISSASVKDYPVMINTFLSNFTKLINESSNIGLSLHTYYRLLYTDYYKDKLHNDTQTLVNYCTSYGINCSKIAITEWNLNKDDGISFSNNHIQGNARALSDALNMPYDISTYLYKWASNSANDTCSSEANFSMVRMSDQSYRTIYNVTKSFAHLFPGGSSIKQSSSNDDCIRPVSGIDGTKYNIALINTCTTSKNVSITQFPSITYGRVREYGQQVFYTLDSNIDLGIMDSYEIKYLTTENCEQGISGTNCLCSAGYTLNDDGLTCWTTTDLSNPSNPFFPSYQMMNGIAGAIILIIVATLSIAYFKFKRINVLQYVGGLSGILIGAWILSVLWNAIT